MADRTIICGDAIQSLLTLPSSSVDCCITSPPYYKARRYGVDGEYGQEATADDYLAVMVSVMRQVKRVLKPTGTLWLVVGDRYDNKSLSLIPYRLAERMIGDGWILRNVVIWAKTNHLPHPVRDRLSNSHEPIFFFTRSGRYFFDLNAVRIPHRSGPSLVPWNALDDKTLYDRADEVGTDTSAARTYSITSRRKSNLYVGHPLGKNPGDVWAVTTVSEHRDAQGNNFHWATFPESLVLPMILAGCPPDGTVLDPFCGVGTTLVVALRTGRNAIGIDLDPRCVEATRKRTDEILSQPSLLDGTTVSANRTIVRQQFIDGLYMHPAVEEIGTQP